MSAPLILRFEFCVFRRAFELMVTYARFLAFVLAIFFAVLPCSTSFGQTYGVELHNSLMPASSGMGGASFSQPQDLQSAIYANPATMTQFQGTQFSFGGGWAEPTINLQQATSVPLIGVDPFQAKSQAPGSLVGNIGVLHDIYVQGRPVKLGLGFMTNAGVGVDYRQVPESNGTHLSLLAFGYGRIGRYTDNGSFVDWCIHSNWNGNYGRPFCWRQFFAN